MNRRIIMARRRLATARKPHVKVLPAPTDVIVGWDVPVTVRDGTVLRVNVFRPDTAQPVPVIMCAHPYGKDAIPAKTRRGSVSGQFHVFPQPQPITFSEWTSWEAPDPATWVARGYAVVNADLRGSGTSDGIGELLSALESRDYHDLIEWAGTQSWSTGRVGLLGVSYLAISQYGAAATRPPHLAAICPWEGLSDLYRDLSYPGGVREDGFSKLWSAITAHTTRMKAKLRDETVPRTDREDWYDAHAPRLEDIYVPMLVCGSFSDHNLHTRGSFEAFRRTGSTQRWLYTHRDGKWSNFYSADSVQTQAEFFDHFLKGLDNGWQDRPPVRLAIYDHGAMPVQVTEETSWPPSDLTWQELHLNFANMQLQNEPNSVPESTEFDLSGAGLQLWWTANHDLDIVGHAALRLWVELQGTDDAHLFIGIRKYRDGKEIVFEGSYGFAFDMVTRGWQRIAHRELDEALSTPWQPVGTYREAAPLAAGEVVPLDIALLPHATRMRAGDQLRLDIRGRWHYPRNPLTGQFPAAYQASKPGTCIVHSGPERDSHLYVGTRSFIES